MQRVIQQIPYYIPLLGIFAFGFLGFFAFPFDRVFQTGVVVATGVAYLVWGVVYHTIHKDLSVAIFIEYAIFGAFGVAAVLTLL